MHTHSAGYGDAQAETCDLDLPTFTIRDLDQHPHHPDSPMYRRAPHMHRTTTLASGAKSLTDETDRSLAHLQLGATGLPSPAATPSQTSAGSQRAMKRSSSDLSRYTQTSTAASQDDGSRSPSLFKSGSFTLPALFRWRKTLPLPDTATTDSPPGDALARPEAYFEQGHARFAQLERGLAQEQAQLADSAAEALQDERRRRHRAEDRLVAVEEEVTRLCTICLPSDRGEETGDLYFESLLASIRLAMDAYEARTRTLTEEAERRAVVVKQEQRRVLELEIENAALRQQLRQQVPSQSVRRPSTTEARTPPARPAEPSTLQAEEEAVLMQRLQDTEAQRDALRDVARMLRQRLTHETRRFEAKLQGQGHVRSSRPGSSSPNAGSSPQTPRSLTLAIPNPRPLSNLSHNTLPSARPSALDMQFGSLEMQNHVRDKLSLHRPRASVGTFMSAPSTMARSRRNSFTQRSLG